MRNSNRYIGLSVLGYLCCILPPIATTLWQFPGWINRSAGCTVSGIALFFLILAIYPLIRAAKKHLQTPSIPLVWGLVTLLLLLLRSIIDQALLVSAVGTASACIGWMIFLSRDREQSNKEE